MTEKAVKTGWVQLRRDFWRWRLRRYYLVEKIVTLSPSWSLLLWPMGLNSLKRLFGTITVSSSTGFIMFLLRLLKLWEPWASASVPPSCVPNIGQGCMFSSVQFSRSAVSDSLWPHGLQHARPPCPSPTPRVYPNSCPLSWWCHPTISSSVVPFSSCPQSFPAAGSFQMSQLFTSGGQTTGVSASTSVLPMNIQDWFPLGWTGWISLQSKGLSRVFSNTTVQKHHSSILIFLYSPTLTSTHDYWKNHSLG